MEHEISCRFGNQFFRLVSHILTDSVAEDDVDRSRRPKSHHGYQNGVTFQNIFAPLEMKKMKPVQMTLFNKTNVETPSKKQNRQFSGNKSQIMVQKLVFRTCYS